MKKLFIVIILFNSFLVSLFAQIDLTEKSKEILDKGIELYKLEKSAWLASDSPDNFQNLKNISGYVSFFNETLIKVIFYERLNENEYIKHYTFNFDNTDKLKLQEVSDQIKKPNSEELMFIQLREGILDLLDHFDGLYKEHENTGINVSIIKENKIYKIYVMSGSTEYGILPLGNDYEFECKENTDIIEPVKKLHQSYIPIDFGRLPKETKTTIHKHSFKSSGFITATDICTILLYQDFFEIKEHLVVSDNYISIFNSVSLELDIFNKKEYNKKFQTNY